jgi:hypothetical protein
MYWKQNKDYLNESYLAEKIPPPFRRPDFNPKPGPSRKPWWKRLFGDSKPVRRTPKITTTTDNDRLFELFRQLMRETNRTARRTRSLAYEWYLVLRELTSSNSQSWQRFLRGFEGTNWQFQNLPDEVLGFINNVNDYFANLRAALSQFSNGEISYASLQEQIDEVIKLFEELRGGRYFDSNQMASGYNVPIWMRDVDPEVYEYISQLYVLLRELKRIDQRNLSR